MMERPGVDAIAAFLILRTLS
nr:hypothetical protein [Rhodococcus qingshengii]